MYERKRLQPERGQERRWIPPYPKRENLTSLLLGEDLFPRRWVKGLSKEREISRQKDLRERAQKGRPNLFGLFETSPQVGFEPTT
jgi:hypothetical protein